MDKNRIERLRYKMEKRKASICSQRAILYTESFKESEEDSYILRKAKAFKHTLENMSIYIENDSLIFGNQASRNFAAPIFPEFSIQWVIDELDEFEKREGDIFYIDEKTKDIIKPAQYGIILTDTALYGAREKFTRNKLNKDKFELFINSVLFSSRR